MNWTNPDQPVVDERREILTDNESLWKIGAFYEFFVWKVEFILKFVQPWVYTIWTRVFLNTKNQRTHSLHLFFSFKWIIFISRFFN